MSRGKARLRAYNDRVTQAHILEQATRNPHTKLTARRSADGDPARLRGIPVQGAPGVSGTMRGTQPEAETIRRITIYDLSPDDPPFFRKVIEREENEDTQHAREQQERRFQEWNKRAEKREQRIAARSS